MAQTAEIGRNVEQIRKQATRVIRGRMPAQVRKELLGAVKLGQLGRLPKDGLKPEIFFHPDHLHGARERQQREFDYSVSLLKGVFASQERLDELFASPAP